MRSKKSLLQALRRLHLYLGVFTTPALIFFAITGGIQTFSLHETTKNSSYKPPKILTELGMLHKKQNFAVPAQRPQPAPSNRAVIEAAAPVTVKPTLEKSDASVTGRPDTEKPTKLTQKNLLPMKIFFLIVSISLFTSAVTGLCLSYKYIRNKHLVTAALIAGLAVPLLLLVIA